MISRSKKDAILIWLSLSKYEPMNNNSEFIYKKIREKYPQLKLTEWKNELDDILLKLEEQKLIEKKTHNEFTINKNDSILNSRIVSHYSATIKGNRYVQSLPDIHLEEHNEATVEYLNLLLKYMPEYGFFDSEALTKHYIPTGTDLYFDALPTNPLLTKIFFYLIDNGYAIWRTDVKLNTSNFYIELTEKGRVLKSKGNLQEFKAYKKRQETQDRFYRGMTEYTFWITVSIALSSFVAAVYYFFQVYDGKPIPHPYTAIIMLLITLFVFGLLVRLKYAGKDNN